MTRRQLLATIVVATAAQSAGSPRVQSANWFVGTESVEYDVGRRIDNGGPLTAVRHPVDHSAADGKDRAVGSSSPVDRAVRR